MAALAATLDDRGVLHANLDAQGYALAKAALGLADPGEWTRSSTTSNKSCVAWARGAASTPSRRTRKLARAVTNVIAFGTRPPRRVGSLAS